MSLHWAGIRGRARADAGPLLLVAVVVTLVSALSGAIPVLAGDTADAAVRDAVRRAGPAADTTVQARWEPDYGMTGRLRMPRLADDIADLRARSSDELGPALRPVMLPPVSSVITPTLKITDGSVLRTLRMAYLSGDGDGPRVDWVAGAEPAPAEEGQFEVGEDQQPWRVQVGVSETVATTMGVRPGTVLKVADDRGNPKNVQVSGIFRAVDSTDPGWRTAPWLLNPGTGLDGAGTTRFGGLLSAGSLPDARLAFDEDQLRRTITFSPDPARLTWDGARRIIDSTVQLEATSASSSNFDTSSTWQSGLDSVLKEVAAQIEAATVQASVLLTALLAGAALVLMLAAELVVRRRSAALVLGRQRGVSLPALGAELLLESLTVAVTAAGAGCAIAYAVTGGVGWAWTIPVLLVAALAVPAYAIVVAGRATSDRRTPANRAARRWIAVTALLRRLAAEMTVLAAAALALVALHQRGLETGLPTAAPTLAVIVGGLLLVRVLPLVTGAGLRLALRSRWSLPVFGTAQAAAVSRRVLPVLALSGSAALATFALVLGATVERGLEDGARVTVGADARVDLDADADAATVAEAQRIAAVPGVTAVVTGQVIDGARVVADGKVTPVRLVIVDRPSPVLARGALRPGMALDIPQDGAPGIRVVATGVAPAVGGATDVLIVGTGSGVPSAPNTIWVDGPGAASAVSGLPAVLRSAVLASRQTAPLVAGLVGLTWVTAVFLLVAGLLGFALAAAAGAPERWQTLSRLRTLGLTPRDARRVAAGSLLPLALLAAVGGPLLGVGVVLLVAGPLGLSLLTGQVDTPALVLPWAWITVVAAGFPVLVAVVVRAESVVRRRLRLADVLRVGG
ncbi:FtsX-like permease family protein [Actinoplanes derwentensis]|uniref:Putative ABC transport system permease protein n=1 Tax=Actinoplanes derwentensis TaxID=113562 RepID=A0A1H1WZQ1_9ACTN|nr:FtsX-like permease family protein [Actinoplanes derwentensis]GID85767.1 membrane protein [Actinoplanes derwentensis]SDT02575.1 putative ABC transport system permease protein [Actinoplanes derwentensis]